MGGRPPPAASSTSSRRSSSTTRRAREDADGAPTCALKIGPRAFVEFGRKQIVHFIADSLGQVADPTVLNEIRQELAREAEAAEKDEAEAAEKESARAEAAAAKDAAKADKGAKAEKAAPAKGKGRRPPRRPRRSEGVTRARRPGGGRARGRSQSEKEGGAGSSSAYKTMTIAVWLWGPTGEAGRPTVRGDGSGPPRGPPNHRAGELWTPPLISGRASPSLGYCASGGRWRTAACAAGR